MSCPESMPGPAPGELDEDTCDDCKVLLLGEEDCGRLTLCRALLTGRPVIPGEPVRLLSYRSRVAAPNGHRVPVRLRVVPAEDHYSEIRTLEYPDTKAAILCFAVDDPDSFAALPSKWLPEIKEHLPAELPIFLVANKVDKANRSVTEEQGRSAVELVGARAYFECSAYTGAQVQELLHAVAKVLLENCGSDFLRNNAP